MLLDAFARCCNSLLQIFNGPICQCKLCWQNKCWQNDHYEYLRHEKVLEKETESKRKMMRVFGMRLNVLLQLYRLSSGSLRCILFSCFSHTMQRVWQKKIGVDAGIGSTLMQQSKRTEWLEVCNISKREIGGVRNCKESGSSRLPEMCTAKFVKNCTSGFEFIKIFIWKI